MFVGYMRRRKKPGHMAKLTSIMCEHIGLKLIYFQPKNINKSQKKIKGKILLNNEWKEIEVGIPKFIDIHPRILTVKKYRQLMRFLETNSELSIDKRVPLPKDRLQLIFKEDKDISKILIPTSKIKTLETIDEFLSKYKKVVIKPVNSRHGKNVFLLERINKKYILGFNREEKSLTKKEVHNFFKEKVLKRKYIIQKYISSITEDGHPFDCRIHVEKNGFGKWENPRNYIRIGIGQKVISNVSQGGGIANLRKFLQANFNEKWEVIEKEIKQLAKILPYKIEDVLQKKYMTFGFDIGIDKDGSLYIFEVNANPIVSPMPSKVAMLRSNYYKYVLEKQKNVDLDDRYERLLKETEQLKRERKKLKEELEETSTDYIHSTSWRITKPVRIIGGLLKKLRLIKR